MNVQNIAFSSIQLMQSAYDYIHMEFGRSCNGITKLCSLIKIKNWE